MLRNTIRDSQAIKRKILNVKYLLVDCDGVLREVAELFITIFSESQSSKPLITAK